MRNSKLFEFCALTLFFFVLSIPAVVVAMVKEVAGFGLALLIALIASAISSIISLAVGKISKTVAVGGLCASYLIMVFIGFAFYLGGLIKLWVVFLGPLAPALALAMYIVVYDIIDRVKNRFVVPVKRRVR